MFCRCAINIVTALFLCTSTVFAADTSKIQKLYQSGIVFLDQNNTDSSAIVLQQGLDLSRGINNVLLEATGLYYLARLYEQENKLPAAIKELDSAVVIFSRLNRKKNLANCYNAYNRIYQTLGDYSKALSYGLQGLRINEALNNKSGLAVSYTTVGNVYLLTEQYDDALVNFTKALAIDSANNDPEGISISLLNIGVALQKKGNYDNALEKYRQALTVARHLNNTGDIVWLLNNIGSTQREKGRPDSALVYLNESLSIAEENNISHAHVLNDLVETYLALKEPESAKRFALHTIEVSKKEQNLSQLQFAWKLLGDSYNYLGDYRNAYRALQVHALLKDSILNVEKLKQINELQVQYETEKKEQSIALLKKEGEANAFRKNAYLAGGVMMAAIFLLLYNRQRITSRRNRQMYEKEKEVDRMKTTFFSNISHEFRTPLTLILGPIQSVRDATDDPAMSKQLTTMEHNARRLLSLVDQLLYLSKLESGKLEFLPLQIDIVPLIRGVVMNFSSVAAERQIALQVTATTPQLIMSIDKEKIETVMINLLSNAFKFTPPGGSIEVFVNVSEDTGKSLCSICVKDTGTGISEKDILHIFDRFYQGEEGHKLHYGGSGIGLALAKELVQLHYGNIAASPNDPEGTTITILLPFEENDAAQRSSEAPVEVAIHRDPAFVNIQPSTADEDMEQGDGRPVLLIIEDNRDVMLYIKDVLQNAYMIKEAVNGEEGITCAIKVIPDLIISDVMMPEKDGYEVCEILKQDERTSHIPLILLTAKASIEDKLQGLQQKADEYLTKPFSPKELLVRVANLINSRKALREKYRRELVLKPSDIAVSSLEEIFLQKVMQIVEEKMADEDFSVVQLATEAGMSRSQLHRKLQALTNQSATEFIRYYRLTRAMDMIKRNAGSIAEIGYKVGFSSPSYFSKTFLQQYGITPGQARSGSSES